MLAGQANRPATDHAVEPTKAYLKIEDGDTLAFQFNPAELRITKSNTWEGRPAKGKDAPQLRFQQGESGTLSFTAVFDTTHDGTDVTCQTSKLLALMRTNENIRGADVRRNKARPPWVEFWWGQLRSFKAVVESLSISFVYFAHNGTALRAKADITLRQYGDDKAFPLQNPTSHTPAPQRLHRVQPGETLDRIAASHYGDPTVWRRIADANRLDDPLALAVGTSLVIPEQEVVRRGR
ncbi:MAG: LysM peptidoglycan-binding domain-containing protein [Actinomycetota bacterium]|nr:LysM peptidoglycan-binding domain-containing protein [Actinomycetota bacterium]